MRINGFVTRCISGSARLGLVLVLACVAGACGNGDEEATVVSIPAGTYLIGPDEANPDNGPAHEVTLDAYEIDIYEVTNRDFQNFINSGECPGPLIEGNPDPCVYDGAVQSVTHEDYWTSSQYLYYPVINLRWDQAEAYCRWAGKRLPTEAEWEVAARGDSDGDSSNDDRLYPWGNTPPTCDQANYEGCVADTMEVGSLVAGVSPFGVYDMAGNVAEWVNDYYNATYYQWGETDNPQGPTSGSNRVVRGGSWYCSANKTTSTFRDQANPLLQYNSVGFRCARSAQ